MANKSYVYAITWCLKEDGNRTIAEVNEVMATTVPRAISKLVRELNKDLETSDKEYLKSSDILVIDVRCEKLTATINKIRALSA